jgi:vesicle transport through interaction with t-SNAREs protein 1
MDNSPTTLFDNYEQDFEQIIASIRDKMEGSAKGEGVGEFLSRDERVSVEVARG